MKLPKSLKILGVEHRIEVVDWLIERQGAEGMFVPAERVIYLDRSILKHKEYALRTLWHEIGHAYAMESGLHEIIAEQAAEQFCQTFSSLVISLTGGKLKSR